MRQTRVGRSVGRASAARRPRVGRMRPIWRVIAAITPMRRPHAADGVTVATLWKSHTRVQIPSAITSGTGGKSNTIGYVTSFYDFPRSICRIYYELLSVGRTRRPHCVGRAAAALRRP